MRGLAEHLETEGTMTMVARERHRVDGDSVIAVVEETVEGINGTHQ